MTVEIPLTSHQIMVLAALIAWGVAASATALLFRRLWTRPSTARNVCLVAATAVVSLGLSVLAVEYGVSRYWVESQGFGKALATQRWFDRHWKPVNRYGFRDIEYEDSTMKATRRLFVVGDSLVAGHGIANAEDRFPDRLRTRLGPGWSVVAMARPGWDTSAELAALRTFPYRPDVIVLSYFVNDVLGAAARRGMRFDVDTTIRPGWLTPLVEHSHLVNLVYWRLNAPSRDPAVGLRYREFLEEAFEREDTWLEHAGDLIAVRDFARGSGAKLLVVTFPMLADVEWSSSYSSKVARFLAQEGVEVIDLAYIFEDRDPADLFVNARDHHPNEATHREVAELIHERLRTRQLIPETP